MIDIRQLQVFMAVWENRSFSRAAQKIYLTQPTVSGHIRELEEALGVQLFDRGGRKVIPTRAGEFFYPFVRQILKLSSQAEREMALFLGEKKGSLNLGGSNIPGQYILPALISQFKASRPDVQVILRIADTAAITMAVADSDLELGMVGAVIPKTGLRFEPCFHEEMVLIVPPGHPFAGREQIGLDDLVSEPLIVREKGSGTRLAAENALKAAGNIQIKDLHIVAEIGSTEAVRQAVKAGLGCSIISRRAVEDDLKYGLLYASGLEGIELHRQFYLVWHSHRTPSPLASAFRDFILQKCRALGSGLDS